MLLYLFCNKSHYENVPFEIPENWCWVTGNDIFNAMISCKPQGDEFKYIEIDSIDNKNHRIISPKILKVKNAPSRASRYTQPGDVLFSMVRPYLKNIALVEEGSCIASTGFFVCSPMQLLTSEYCYYMMLSDYVIYGLNQYMKGDNSPSINNGHITSWLYPIPPINEQLRISAEIKKWFVFIDDLERGKIELESLIKQVKSKILDLAISGKLVSQDPNDEPAIELLKRINPSFEPCDNSHYGNLPQGWTIVGLHSVAEIITGSTPSKLNAEYYNGDVPFYKPNDLDQGRHVRCASEYLSQQGKSISRSIPCNSIAVCCIGSIGKCGFIEKEGVTNQQINTIVPNDAIFPLYMYYFCNSSTFIDELKSLSSAVTISIVNKSKLSTIQIPLPPIAEQKRIISVIEKLYSHLDMITAEL